MAETRITFANLSADRWLWLAVYAAVLGAWLLLATLSAASETDMDFWAALCRSAEAAEYPAVLAMWALMVLAMMLPTFVPTLTTFLDLRASGASRGTHAASLIAGYIAIWLTVAAIGAAAQVALAQIGALNQSGASVLPWLNAALLIGAGLYQISPLKEACLSQCRSPMMYFLGRWRPGHRGALSMGLELGAVCVGCCWALMALAFVGGTMNLLWMGAATLFMALEKLPDIGRPLTKPLGAVLIGWGLVTLI